MGYEPIDAWYEEQQEATYNGVLEHYRSSDEYAEDMSRAIEDFVSERQREAKIFISYRRDDTEGQADRLYDWLCKQFNRDQIFMDIDNIESGEDFVEVIQRGVGCCAVLIAIIGKRWLNSTDDIGRRRLDNPDDFVRLEIMTAIERNIRVIPVLVQGATMPKIEELPEALAKLGRYQALELSRVNWAHDVERLIQSMKESITS
jgi:hypothetical protein